MFKDSSVMSAFSVDDLKKAKQFYGEILGFDVREEEDMGLSIHFANGGRHFIYPKDNHEPATFTVLNIFVDNIDDAVASLKNRGVFFESYELPYQNERGETEIGKTDESGIMRSGSFDKGPDIAWFKDPAGNILALLQSDRAI
jgi:predicted enzyme related to lactoylglutathione lyase